MSRRVPARVLALFYEKRVGSFAGLQRELRRLDSDAGVRIAGSYLKRPCFAFVTRFVGSYTVMVYERRGRRAPAVGKRILSREFGSPEELEGLLRKIAAKKVEAYVY